MVVIKVKKRLEKSDMALIVSAVSLISPAYTSAHIFDERPGLGTGMTIFLSAFWIAVVIGIIIVVRRLIRPKRGATVDRSGKDNTGSKE